MISMNKCRIVGAIALPVTKEDKKKRKYTQRPLTVPIGPKLIKAYIEKNKKSK